MRVLFLDIDGVLVSTRFISACENDFEGDEVDPFAVESLNEIIHKSGAKVVISSTWRLLHSLDWIRQTLEDAGFEGEIIGRTPDLITKCVGNVSACRGDEIQLWLKHEKRYHKFAILDDDCDMGCLRDHLVRTTMQSGLLPEHIPAALKILGVKG